MTDAGLSEAEIITMYVSRGEKQRAMRLAGQAFSDWLRELARIAHPEDPVDWLVGVVVLNEDCWFDSFSEGLTPAECWAEESSYAEE